jgi:hypothetical protein
VFIDINIGNLCLLNNIIHAYQNGIKNVKKNKRGL